MRILILGARAPACLEWVRIFHRAGIDVWVADSMQWPVAKFSRFTRRFIKLPPVKPFAKWQQALKASVDHYRFDYVLPTCEEVFYLAKAKEVLPAGVTRWVSDLSILNTLHNKFAFSIVTAGLSINTPKTLQVTNAEQLAEALNTLGGSSQCVLKPVYSRFASQAFVAPSANELAIVTKKLSEKTPWAVQQYIRGRELCSYAIAEQGELVAHSCYQGKYRAGNGASIYFEPVDCNPLCEFARELVKRLNFSGQLGFDFIVDDAGKVWVIECNPRATSGIHLLGHDPHALVAKMLRPAAKNNVLQSAAPRMVAQACLLYHFTDFFKAEFWRDFKRARDVLAYRQDPGPAYWQILPVMEFAWRALKSRQSLIAATTQDIEWCGDIFWEGENAP